MFQEIVRKYSAGIYSGIVSKISSKDIFIMVFMFALCSHVYYVHYSGRWFMDITIAANSVTDDYGSVQFVLFTS